MGRKKSIGLSALATIQEQDVAVQQISINNQVQILTRKQFFLTCPKCGRVLYSFPENIKKAQAYLARCKQREYLLKIASYCPSCGTKLYYGDDFIEGDIGNEK